MGVVITARRDGFRRGGIAHMAAGVFYADGALTEDQLKAFRNDPQLVVTEQAEPFTSAGQDEPLLGEMGNTIAALEHSLENARAGLKTASADLVRILEQQKAAPALIVAEAQALEPADPTTEGVICIAGDTLLSLISQHLKPVQASPEAPNDESDTTLDNSSGAEAPQSTSQAAPGTSPSGADSGAVATDKQDADKPAGRSKRGSGKGDDK
ncbi:HI1506-related protein [Pseudomonas corrugata]|uniref:HI1506-related protein n=1 Tax=Pseudomonas corrugata TaxID=47879 RepID=UPI0006D8AD71|nr:HI1506-related protein [Pseudomonas corrugata]